MGNKKLWWGLGLVTALSFAVLGWFGREIYRQAPPIPEQVATVSGRVLFTGQEIRDGQNVWQSIGGQQIGSIWGHGAYVAPDWSADWLHRESLVLLNGWAAQDHGRAFETLTTEQQAALRERLKQQIRANTFDAGSGTVLLSDERGRSVDAMARYYTALFGDAQTFDADLVGIADGGRSPRQLREEYAIAEKTLTDPRRQRQMAAFFFWTAWAAGTERPATATAAAGSAAATAMSAGDDAPRAAGRATYTNNWPHEPLIDNRPTSANVLWSLVSVLLLLAGVGTLAWYYARQRGESELGEPPATDPLLGLTITPSMRATLKFFWTVAGLLLVQVGLGVLTAHYGVEGQGFFGLPLAKWLPYAVTRTWHIQTGLFWIATAWLATGLYVAPAISGHEPRFQRFGVNFLYSALLLIVAGTLFGTWYATRQRMGLGANFWFGHQGYEYVDLGRFWQIFLFVGLFLWLFLMFRAVRPAFRRDGENKHLLGLFIGSTAAIALFYGAGLMWGRQTHLAVAEYWRWWVVHLWVEGFFEVFATAVLAFLFTKMGLLRSSIATKGVLFSTTIFLSGGIVGTFHHLYFAGTPVGVMALGAVFSALEVVPLVLMGIEASKNLGLLKARPWMERYRWPLYFFVAVAFWNLVGAGLFGFLINPPIALFYMQGLNTTPVHGHTALFGVYGMLGIGLMLFCLRGLSQKLAWNTAPLRFSFWALNIGLSLMVLLSLLPVGILQTLASVQHGLWYARSAEFLQGPVLEKLRWLRVIGDVIFVAGVVALAWFVVGLKTGWSYARVAAGERDAGGQQLAPGSRRAGSDPAPGLAAVNAQPIAGAGSIYSQPPGPRAPH